VIEQRLSLLLRLKLLLRDVHPAVWRRVKLADSLSIADMHRGIQMLMGWDGDHLHRFRIHGRDYGIAGVAGPSFDANAAAVRLASSDAVLPSASSMRGGRPIRVRVHGSVLNAMSRVWLGAAWRQGSGQDLEAEFEIGRK
jgi:hypothetical protein